MNTDFLHIITTIVTEQGEAILSDPRRVSAFFADLAREIPKPQKNAFVKCLEQGFASVLKNSSAAEREACKQRLARKLHAEEGFDLGLCGDTLDVLESALFTEEAEAEAKDEAGQAVFCQNCGKELQEEWKLCPYCSTPAAQEEAAEPVPEPEVKHDAAAGGIIIPEPEAPAADQAQESAQAPAQTQPPAKQGAEECKKCLLLKDLKCKYYNCTFEEAAEYDCDMKAPDSQKLQKKRRRRQRVRFFLLFSLFTCIMIGVSIAFLSFTFPWNFLYSLWVAYVIAKEIGKAAKEKRRNKAKRLSP